jgi:uncharacterized protein YeaO (DUF488 family)
MCYNEHETPIVLSDGYEAPTSYPCVLNVRGQAIMIRVKRVYEPLAPEDGQRFLVDRLWPRGVKREALALAGWLREVAPSNDLRQAFCHDPAKWDEFQQGYHTELDAKPEAWQPILEAARQGDVTLLYSAHDTQHNNAVALQAYLATRNIQGT